MKLLNGGTINTNSSGPHDAGDISIEANDLLIDGVSSEGSDTGIFAIRLPVPATGGDIDIRISGEISLLNGGCNLEYFFGRWPIRKREDRSGGGRIAYRRRRRKHVPNLRHIQRDRPTPLGFDSRKRRPGASRSKRLAGNRKRRHNFDIRNPHSRRPHIREREKRFFSRTDSLPHPSKGPPETAAISLSAASPRQCTGADIGKRIHSGQYGGPIGPWRRYRYSRPGRRRGEGPAASRRRRTLRISTRQRPKHHPGGGLGRRTGDRLRPRPGTRYQRLSGKRLLQLLQSGSPGHSPMQGRVLRRIEYFGPG